MAHQTTQRRILAKPEEEPKLKPSMDPTLIKKHPKPTTTTTSHHHIRPNPDPPLPSKPSSFMSHNFSRLNPYHRKAHKPQNPTNPHPTPCVIDTCGAKEFDIPGPLCIGPKARTEEGEIAKDGQRKPKWPRNVAEDDLALSIPNPKRREQHTGKSSLPERPKEKDKYSRIPIGIWCRSNPMRNCYLRIECTQLTF